MIGFGGRFSSSSMFLKHYWHEQRLTNTIILCLMYKSNKLLLLSRLRRRIESYRRRQSDCMPRFDQSFSGLCEQNLQDTLQLKQRFLDTKAKRAPKTNKDKKQESIQSSVHVVCKIVVLQIFLTMCYLVYSKFYSSKCQM